jgi:hypothetical protein
MDLKTLYVNSILCECGQVYGQQGNWSIDTRVKEHHQLNKSEMVELVSTFSLWPFKCQVAAAGKHNSI